MAAPRPKSPHRLHAHALSNSSTLSNSIDMREDISFFSVSRENAPHQTHHPLRCIRHITCGVHLLARSSDRWRLWLLWRWQIWRRTAHSASRVEYGVAYRAKRAEQFHNELRYSVGIQLSSAVWTYRTAKGWEVAFSNSFDALSNSFEHVPRDKECAVVQSLKPKVAHFVTLEFSFDAVPRGVLKLQNVGSRMLLLECVSLCRRQRVRHSGWSIHVCLHRPRRTGRSAAAARTARRTRLLLRAIGPALSSVELVLRRSPDGHL